MKKERNKSEDHNVVRAMRSISQDSGMLREQKIGGREDDVHKRKKLHWLCASLGVYTPAFF